MEFMFYMWVLIWSLQKVNPKLLFKNKVLGFKMPIEVSRSMFLGSKSELKEMKIQIYGNLLMGSLK